MSSTVMTGSACHTKINTHTDPVCVCQHPHFCVMFADFDLYKRHFFLLEQSLGNQRFVSSTP